MEKYCKLLNEIYTELQKYQWKHNTDVITGAGFVLQEINKDVRQQKIFERPATERQKWKLGKLGIPFDESITFNEARKLIGEKIR